jgi:DNA-binding response OmpR family regulator
MMQIQIGDEGTDLAGLRLLVVEDNYLVAADMCSSLQRRGAAIMGPVANESRGRELVRQQRPDVVLLDVNLNGHLAFDLAHELESEGIRMIFTTGYDVAFLPESLRDSPCLQKPINLSALVQLIRATVPSAH